MIDPLPTPPQSTDPTNFEARADAFMAALPTFTSQANATAAAMNLNSTTDTSVSSLLIATGAKAFAVSAGKSFQPGMYLVAADVAAPSTNSMFGQVTSYDVATGALVMNIMTIRGAGTIASWVISQSSAGGAVAGPLATSGITGAAASGANSDITSLTILPGYLFGCTLSTAGSSATMSIAAGRATDSTGLQSMALTAIAKTTSAWAVGTAAGGLDTGAIANSTWYHFYVIRRPDTGVVDVLFSLSATAPTLPANYTQFRRIGSGKTDGSAQWTAFLQTGEEFLWVTPVFDVNSISIGVTPLLSTLTIPTGVSVRAIVSGRGSNSDGACDISIYTPGTAPNSGVFGSSSLGNFFGVAGSPVRTNTSGQVYVYASQNSTSLNLYTSGWIDSRGKDA